MKTQMQKFSKLEVNDFETLKKGELIQIKGGTEEGTVGGTQKDGDFD